jgi:hypothetical protein
VNDELRLREKQYGWLYQILYIGCRVTCVVQGFRSLRLVEEDTTDGAALLLSVEDRVKAIGDLKKDSAEGSVDKERQGFSVFFVPLLGVASDCRLPVLEEVLEEFIMAKA